jgi:peptide/nickel transport system substrate-binding protein
VGCTGLSNGAVSADLGGSPRTITNASPTKGIGVAGLSSVKRFSGTRPKSREGLSTRVLGVVTVGVLLAAACSPVGQETDSGAGNDSAKPEASSAARTTNVGEPADPAAVKKGGELTLALSADPDLLDPSLARSLYSRYIFNATCEKLYDTDAEAKVVPQLAAGMPEVSADGKTVTIKVRTGIKFGDGTPFNAAAVKTSLDRNLTLPESARVSELGPITKVEAPDDETVVIHLSAPFAPLTAALADRAGMVMSPTQLDKLGDKFATEPICVGAFKVVKRVPQNSIELEKDPNYYDADKVYLDRIVYRIITDASIRAANLRSGDAQVADSVSTQDVAALEKESGITLLETESLGYQGVTFNVGNVDGVTEPAKPIDKPHAKDAKVRQAFDHAIDREALVKTVFAGLYSVACSPISPATEFSTDAAQECRDHDPAKAKRLLKQAGVKTPYKIEMLATNTPDALRIAQALQAMVKPSGFEIVITPTEFSTLLDQQDRGDFELLQLGWSGRVDPDSNITNFVGTQASQNVSGFSDPELDDLLTKARQSQDTAERADLYGQVATKLREQEPLIYLYRARNLTGVSDDVQGVQVFPDGVIRLARAGLTK